MDNKKLRPIDEQIYDFLTNSSMTYEAIGQKLGVASTTVASHARKMVEQYNFNPSVLRASRRTKQYARYCQNIVCHDLCYFTAEEIKKGGPFYCSPPCSSSTVVAPPPENKVRELYSKTSFGEVSKSLGMSLGMLARVFEHYNIEPEEFPESVLVTPANIAQRQTQRINQRRSAFSNTRTGYREHLGFSVRSSWENNFCLYLAHKKIRYEYEPKSFYFPEKTGAQSFLPDYLMTVRGKEVWCEVKGWIRSKDITKMKRLKKHHPDVFSKMTYVVEKPGCKADISYKQIGLKPFVYYNEIQDQFGHLLKNWES